MSKTVHLIITGESGKTFRLPFSKNKFYALASCLSIVTFLLCYLSITGVRFWSNKNLMEHEISKLQNLREDEISKLEKKLNIANENITRIKSTKEENEAILKLQLKNLELENSKQAATFKEERNTLISSAINDLKERSRLMESVMGGIGVKVETTEPVTDNENKGGPFIAYPEGESSQLIQQADKYLNIIKYLPIGKPTGSKITSPFGARNDPFNTKVATHKGIDFSGAHGDRKIYATGDGVVTEAYRSATFGNYVVINHGNGYKSSFAHMAKFFVTKGEKIKRKQLIGIIGNTGRSKGAHLHYEIHLDNKPINPANFITLKIPEKKLIKAKNKKVLHVQ